MNFFPFRRIPRSPDGAPATPGTPPSPAMRQWMVRAVLSLLSLDVGEALYTWLLAPTDPQRWPPPETFEPRRFLLRREDYWDQPLAEVYRLLRDELRALRQTLDLPPEAISGLTRNGLLLAHAMRLRQLEWRLWPRFTARQIRRLIA